VPFSQEEIKDTITLMPSDKAPGLDGFSSAFFKSCWEIIKDDVTAAINNLFHLNSQGFELMNSANIVLLPKRRTHCGSQITDPSVSYTALQRSSQSS
jgi:hypothetical protein